MARYNKIFAAIDGGSTQEAVVRRALSIAHDNNAEVMFGHVIDSVPYEANGIDFAALSDDSIPLDDERLKACDKLALVFGTEGDGLARSTISSCDYTVRIPMQHGVDSLNVAASSAVAFWELRSRG